MTQPTVTLASVTPAASERAKGKRAAPNKPSHTGKCGGSATADEPAPRRGEQTRQTDAARRRAGPPHGREERDAAGGHGGIVYGDHGQPPFEWQPQPVPTPPAALRTRAASWIHAPPLAKAASARAISRPRQAAWSRRVTSRRGSSPRTVSTRHAAVHDSAGPGSRLASDSASATSSSASLAPTRSTTSTQRQKRIGDEVLHQPFDPEVLGLERPHDRDRRGGEASRCTGQVGVRPAGPGIRPRPPADSSAPNRATPGCGWPR